MSAIRFVQQEDANGCGVACLAMVTGQTYAEVKAWEGFVGKNFRGDGMTYHDLMQYLTDHGHATALRFRWLPGCSDTGHHTRNPWPTAPYAPAHILSVDGGRHYVVWLRDGKILDPHNQNRTRIEECGEVAYMLGVFDVGPSRIDVHRLRDQALIISEVLRQAGIGPCSLPEGVTELARRAGAL